MMGEEKEYPEYDPTDVPSGELNEECWERYAKRIKVMREKGMKFIFPLEKNTPMVFSEIPGLHKAMIVMMKPTEFLKLSLPKSHIRACSLDFLLDAFEFGEPKLDPLYLSVSGETCEVNGHQGRHRAEIANDLGVEEIPVVIDFSPNYTLKGYDEIRELERRWKEKDFKKSIIEDALDLMEEKWEAPDTCVIENLIPETPRLFKVDIAEIEQRRKQKRKQYGIGDGKSNG